MATKLNKPVTREAVSTTVAIRGNKQAPLIVTIEPPDMITFRAKGSRRRTSLMIGHCLNLAEVMDAESEYKKRMVTYELKRKAGYRCKRPKKPAAWFARVYYRALDVGISKK